MRPSDIPWGLRFAGLVESICEPGSVRVEAIKFAKRLTGECAPLALRAQKETLYQAAFVSGETAKANGERRRQTIRASSDYAEGRLAFLEKRRPVFSGS